MVLTGTKRKRGRQAAADPDHSGTATAAPVLHQAQAELSLAVRKYDDFDCIVSDCANWCFDHLPTVYADIAVREILGTARAALVGDAPTIGRDQRNGVLAIRTIYIRKRYGDDHAAAVAHFTRLLAGSTPADQIGVSDTPADTTSDDAPASTQPIPSYFG